MIRRRAIAFLSGLAFAMPFAAVTDDIEVYTGASLSAGARPNVLFVIDNTVNMIAGHKQLPIHSEYDPDYRYAGNCATDGLYMVSSATKETRFKESFRWDDAPATSPPHLEDDGCAQAYPFYPVLWQKQMADTSFTGPIEQHTVETTFCTSAQDDLAQRGYYEDDFHWTRIEWTASGRQLVHRTGLNDDEIHNGFGDFVMPDYRCRNDGNLLSWSTERFFVFTGNYLNWWFNDRETRLSVAQRGIKKMIDALPQGGVNVGIMPFSENTLGGRILFPAVDINGNAAAMKSAIDSLDGDVGMRAIAGALFESYKYYSGSKPVIGDWNVPKSVPESWTDDGTRYDSPLDLSCQSNHVVVVTDGLPEFNNDPGLNSEINALPSFGGCTQPDEACAIRLAAYMNARDVSAAVDGEQHVSVHAIGIGIPGTESFFNQLVTAGNGEYIVAQSADDLAAAVNTLFEESIVINGTFVAPAVSVNAFNRSQHRNELYFAVFEVGEGYRWNGNLKKYQLKKMDDGSVAVVDVSGVPALDSATGEFTSTSRSWWSNAPDGNNPVLGGANARLASTASRKLYTNVDGGTVLNTAGNELASTNGNITHALTGAPDEATSKLWLDRLKAGDLRNMYGDPLHSRPVVVNYGGTEESPDAVAFFTTNDGLLHAVNPGDSTTTDAAGGYEIFGFMPKEMLAKLGGLTSTGVRKKGYGLDGSVIPWVDDRGTPGVIGAGDHVYLYFGAGRGGRLYYGVDATSYTDPRLLWASPIKGGKGDAFNELGYATADPVQGRIRFGNVDRDVLVISGGYDPDYDILPNEITPDSGIDMGRALYIVDAITGQKIWSGSSVAGADKVFGAMTAPIAAGARALDMNSDGYLDRIYVGDLKGQLWRFDINNEANSAAMLVDGGVIADLGGGLATDDGMQKRRFFNTPDVVFVSEDVETPYLAINIGSGNRSHPVADTFTQDIFFSIKDPYIYDKPDSYGYGITLDGTDLVDITNQAAPSLPASSHGWYLRLRSQEKVLAESRTFENHLIFTTYQPTAADPDSEPPSGGSCAPDLGIGRVYALDVRSARAVIKDGTPDTGDRDLRLARSGIPPEPSILFPRTDDGEPNLCVGPECPPDLLPKNDNLHRTYWTDDQNEE